MTSHKRCRHQMGSLVCELKTGHKGNHQYKNLPKLIPTKIMEIRNKNLTPSGQNKLGPSKDRAYLRARTYPGIAEAMATQWGKLL